MIKTIVHTVLFALALAFGSLTIAEQAVAKPAGTATKSLRKSGGKKLGAKARSKSRSGGIAWNAGSGCLPASVKAALRNVAANFGPIRINSTYRSPSHNRRVGGARKSMHMQCRAADFRVLRGNRGVLGFLQKQPGLGGIKLYRGGFFHIDDGPRRTWSG